MHESNMFYFGVDYYPEQCPEDCWPKDARMMAEGNFNFVRMAEFAWSRLEPQEGQYDFTWLDRAIDILAAQGMKVILGTPTASPPPWLMFKNPEAYRWQVDGKPVTYGNRREYCPNNPVYQNFSRLIVTQMGNYYAHHPAVIGWQIDNEFGDRCYCPVCASTFQSWLKNRYASLELLNQKWGTVFWSHVYNDWAEIPIPIVSGGSPNPSLALDFYRFSSDSYVDYQQIQIDILRETAPSQFITHNMMGFKYDYLNYYDLSRNLDLVSWDNYIRTQWDSYSEIDPSRAALGHDTMRSLKHQSFWVMEQQAGPGGWEQVSVSPHPGELRLWAYQSIAHGADGIVFFRWRTARHGTEQFWHGLLDHDGSINRRSQEIMQMGTEIEKVGGQIYGSVIRPAMAMINSYDSRFAFQIQANNPNFHYPEHFHHVYRSFYNYQVPIDVVSPDDTLDIYKLVVAPSLYLISDHVAENLKCYVESGGVLVFTPRAGVKDEANAVINLPLPGLVSELCGIEVEEYISLPVDMQNRLDIVSPNIRPLSDVYARIWCDVLRTTNAEVIARYADDFYAGKPAITINRYGDGWVVYVGTYGDDKLFDILADWILGIARIPNKHSVPKGVEIAERWKGNQKILFILNHTNQIQNITIEEGYVDLSGETEISNAMIQLGPYDVKMLTKL